ncbi:MAG: ABC transporter permease [Planctomycetota bacterium]|jgi:putative ABC transport system permease protein
MIDTLYIAWKYIVYHKVKTSILLVAVTFILFLPLALRVLVRACEAQLMARAATTPLVIGSKGSSLDLAIDTLYLESKPLDYIPFSQFARVLDTSLAPAIPMHTRFSARGHTIVGTTLEYFDFRKLSLIRGRSLTRLGDCVLGAETAATLDLAPGDFLVSAPESLFDLAGTYPLKMRVVGVLDRSHTPDDDAVFVDYRTSWVIAGLGHGHEDLAKTGDPDVLLGKDGETLRANAKLLHYNEITDANIDSFHFHGDQSDFPLTAIIALPPDQKSADLLRGKYLSAEETCQVLRPVEVIRDLTATIFRVEGILNGVFGLLAIATLLLVALVMMLSLRLRAREMLTMFKLGCGRAVIAGLVATEMTLLLVASAGSALVLTALVAQFVDSILRALIL